ncbi:ABC transporter substrate-binding protein [Mesorhizobium sp. M1E.F.Ca.ET.041.01.1.1]|uniref:ABC transporter substrate-binding protein n=1 Tax=Mesorhizobium sp. M1E.F.Ca.ET.041.01.1.1 TaxID=2496759 RepID=UPI000FCAF829|nr:ABC transporter substrate-binding protein [Mesorhizobium sp. M1E.F.Ca.ET.041.01.1.1]RUW28168.1 ABC transporter substrate-binding protein [Mesorhizobium sp. M1E.F.Ca.ET.041.01.1.1]RWD81416.1 MAG: ABC transporter substrate-binding protein [Mesorhizobium sp.]
MTITRREIIKAGLAAGTAVSMPTILRAQTPNDVRTVRWVAPNIFVFDPIFSIEGAYHAYQIYDTLLALDSKGIPQPQMVGKWGLSEDKKTYTFQLREGLTFHDGSPVTAADCVASIRRWSQVDSGGKLIMARAKDISKKDEKTFTITLNEPLPLLITLLASSGGYYLAIMREKDASRPAAEQVIANIGSGPFKFNNALAKPGVSFTYDRNEQYISRQEPADGYAGGKVVKVDRVVSLVIADQQTSVAALQAGEVDFVATPPSDLYPLIESDANLALENVNESGRDMHVRMNFLQPPFDNVKARQAMLHLIDQEAIMQAAGFDPKYFRPVKSIFGNSTAYSNDENTGWYKKGGDPEKAKKLFQEAGYSGEKVVILQPTDWPTVSKAAEYLAFILRKNGVNAELAPSDWGGVSKRRANKGPIEDGGWNIYISDWTDAELDNPIGVPLFRANGADAYYGWPKNDQYEGLRARWLKVETLEERKALAREMQHLAWDFVGTLMLGQYFEPIARRKSLTGLVHFRSAYWPMWNIQKVSA